MDPLEVATKLLLLGKPVNDLTDAEAVDLLVALHAAGEITLPDGVRRNAAGKVMLPAAGAKVKGRVGTTMRGVTFNRPTYTRVAGAMGSTAYSNNAFTVTPAFAIVLYKLATMLADKWQVETVVAGGLGVGHYPDVADSHNDGRSIDFYGVVRAGGGTIDVRRDWFLRPVYVLGLLKPFQPKGDDNWGDGKGTYFRLAASLDPEDATPRKFFADVYRFAAEQTTTAKGDPSASNFNSTWVPLTSGHIMHPDYPIISYRRPHNHHMHFQLLHDF